MRERIGPAGVLLVLVAALVVLAGVASAVPGQEVLAVDDAATGDRLLTVPVSEGTHVDLVYMHSVEKSRVLDGYVVRDGQLDNTRMEFEDYGWGLPARANVTEQNGTFVFDPNRSYEEIYVKPGRVAKHKLRVGDETYDLVELSDAQTVHIYVTHRSALETGLHWLTASSPNA